MGDYDPHSLLRGKVAIVGAADDVSPTGQLDITGRALEARADEHWAEMERVFELR